MNTTTSLILYFLLFITIIFYIFLRVLENKKSKKEYKSMLFHHLNLSDAEIALLNEIDSKKLEGLNKDSNEDINKKEGP